MSLIFYDTETTGTATFFDQILQFAAIRTDADLKEIDRFEIRCRLLPHVVPAPGAMRVTGVKVSQLTDPSLPSHYEMIRVIRARLLSWSPALFIGWNSIAFDEDLVRQALYKTLHNPYLTNRDGNTRSDLMRIAQACSIFAPAALKFPTDEEGQKVFKLDRVAPANGFKHDRAHSAMGDVEATMFLCRLIIEKAPDIWSSFMRFSTKAAVANYITEERVFCVSDFFFGNPFSYIVTTIGQNKKNSVEWYIYDLSVDPKSLLALSEAQLAARLDRSPKPLRRLKSNAAPMLFPAEDAPKSCKGLEHGLKELERRAKTLQADAALRQRLISAFESLKEEYPSSPHIEKQIYDGFFEEADEKLMDAFHEAEWSRRYAIVERFQDLRLRTIGRQLIHFERPALLDKTICRKHQVAAAKRLLGQGEDISWLTLPKALEQLEEMLATASGAELKLLREHDQYLRERHKQALTHAK
ncbi:MAG: exodeoxyribonuclease I [Acidobacteria bacterium]|nr:MAG: exodeoxyribonuclease I [Acidobacteriota bacterium]